MDRVEEGEGVLLRNGNGSNGSLFTSTHKIMVSNIQSISPGPLAGFFIYPDTVYFYGGIWNKKIFFIILSLRAAFECVFLWTYLASCFSASAQSSSSPMSTADTSIYGSQTVKPRPIRSIAVRRMVLWAGSLGLGGFSSRKVSALPANGRKSSITIV